MKHLAPPPEVVHLAFMCSLWDSLGSTAGHCGSNSSLRLPQH